MACFAHAGATVNRLSENATSSQHDKHLFVFNGCKLAQVTAQFMKKPSISCVLETQIMPSGSIPAGGDGKPEYAVSTLGFPNSAAPFGDFWSLNVREMYGSLLHYEVTEASLPPLKAKKHACHAAKMADSGGVQSCE